MLRSVGIERDELSGQMDAAQQETGKGKKSVRKSGLIVLPPGQRYCRTEKHPAQHERNHCRTTAHMCVHTNTQTHK